MEIFESLLNIGNIITVLVSAVVTWAGCFLFYRQRKDSMEIENESKQSEEWRKLYVDSQNDSRLKDQKIDALRKEMNEMREHMFKLERQVILNSIYRCDRTDCANRFCKSLHADEQSFAKHEQQSFEQQMPEEAEMED